MGDAIPDNTRDNTLDDVLILLIGLRGSGKSTLGRLLADRLRRPFIDLDDLTAAELGTHSPAEAFTSHGEPAFRLAEARALSLVLAGDQRPSPVVALGGGTPTAPGASDLLQQARTDNRARMVYLRASVNTLRDRLERSDASSRPALTPLGLLDEIATILQRRGPLYTAIADVIIEIDTLTPQQATDQIAAWLSIERLPTDRK